MRNRKMKMLTPASLNIDSYFFTDFNASLDLEKFGELNSVEFKPEDLNSEFVVHEDSQTGNELVVSLKVSVDSSKPSGALVFGASVIGKFHYTEELKLRIVNSLVKEEVVVSNALSILYSSIRDQVYSFTAKMPCGPVFLPTCTFLVAKNDAVVEQQKKPPVRKKAVRKVAAK